MIGGRNKYLINGSNANNTRVQDLFNSVQMNVNNPHFLIMQGRITKVLNMKPPEVLFNKLYGLELSTKFAEILSWWSIKLNDNSLFSDPVSDRRSSRYSTV